MKAKIYTNDFNRIVAATKNFASKSGTRILYKFIRMEFCAADSIVTAVAVDGYRMSIEHSVCECDEDFVAYINASTRLPSNMYATIEVADAEAIIRCGDFIFGCPQKGGEFLDWKSVLPDGEPTFCFGVNGNYLLSALQAAKFPPAIPSSSLLYWNFGAHMTPSYSKQTRTMSKWCSRYELRIDEEACP